LAALLPVGLGGLLTAVPYLIAMISVLYLFLKKHKRAPTQSERKKFTLGFSLIFWGYNVGFLILGLVIFAQNSPNIWQDFLQYLREPQFMALVLIMFLLIAIPLYVLTYWFYGKQAERMVQKMQHK
jgi:uncharacterized membrane protein